MRLGRGAAVDRRNTPAGLRAQLHARRRWGPSRWRLRRPPRPPAALSGCYRQLVCVCVCVFVRSPGDTSRGASAPTGARVAGPRPRARARARVRPPGSVCARLGGAPGRAQPRCRGRGCSVSGVSSGWSNGARTGAARSARVRGVSGAASRPSVARHAATGVWGGRGTCSAHVPGAGAREDARARALGGCGRVKGQAVVCGRLRREVSLGAQ